jgi:hypothetical protein
MPARTTLQVSEPRDESRTSECPLHEVYLSSCPGQLGALALHRRYGCGHSLGRHDVTEVGTDPLQATTGCLPRPSDMPRGEPRQHHGVAAQHVVPAIVRWTEVK